VKKHVCNCSLLATHAAGSGLAPLYIGSHAPHARTTKKATPEIFHNDRVTRI